MRRGSRKTDRLPQQSHPYTPTPDGFERRLRAWVRLPMADIPIPGAGGASASPEAHGVRDHTGADHPHTEGSPATAWGRAGRLRKDAVRGHRQPSGSRREEAYAMRTTRHPIRHVLSLAGMGLMLAGLF